MNRNINFTLNKAVSQVWKTKQYSYKNMARPDHGLLYLWDGEITYTFQDGNIKLKAGDVIYLPKGSNYEVEFNIKNGAVKNYLINFNVTDNEAFTDTDKPTLIANDRAKVLLDAFKSVVDTYNENEMSLLTNSQFYLCLHYLQTLVQYNDLGEERLIFEKAAARLSEHCSVDEVSKDLHMSRSSFQKKFIKYFGLSPTEYKMQKRLKKAKQLLKTTDIPIKEISNMLGFYDTAYFYKVFKNINFVTPTEYRKMENPDF